MRAFVDRFEGDQAVLLLGDDEEVRIAVPINWLPQGVSERMVLKVDFTIDDIATREAKAKVKALYDDLGGSA